MSNATFLIPEVVSVWDDHNRRVRGNLTFTLLGRPDGTGGFSPATATRLRRIRWSGNVVISDTGTLTLTVWKNGLSTALFQVVHNVTVGGEFMGQDEDPSGIVVLPSDYLVITMVLSVLTNADVHSICSELLAEAQ